MRADRYREKLLDDMWVETVIPNPNLFANSNFEIRGILGIGMTPKMVFMQAGLRPSWV